MEEVMSKISRRTFLATASAGGAALMLGGCEGPGPDGPRASGDRPNRRRIWVLGDSHIGLRSKSTSHRDGAEWLEDAVADQLHNVDPVDWVLMVGDASHHAGREEELKRYAAIRDASKMGPWFEIAGNHDHRGLAEGRWGRIIGRPPRYVIRDGNTVFVCVSVEQGNSRGDLSGRTLGWLRDRVRENQAGNVVVVTHQAAPDTVYDSDRWSRIITAKEFVGDLLANHRVDLWLCGHIHGGGRTDRHAVSRGRTQFLNVASMSHAYGSGASHSFTFDIRAGGRTLVARCRHHDSESWLDRHELHVRLPLPWQPGERPTIEPDTVGAQAHASAAATV
jgi:hypothetical protein